MRTSVQHNTASLFYQLGWWTLFLICALFSAYALYMGVLEVLSLLGLVQDAPHRAVPLVFVFHALAGSVVLISGIVQLNGDLRRKQRQAHRVMGYVYVGGVWISGVGGLWSALFFDVGLAARIVFVTLAILWVSATTLALLHIHQRRMAAHRAWMIRSFALSFFFVTAGLWVPALAATPVPHDIGYPLANFLGWSLNLLVAELWIRHTRKGIAQ